MNGLENQKQQNDQQDQQQEEKVERDIDRYGGQKKTTFPALKRTSTASPTAVAKSPSIHRKIRISVLHSMILNGVQAIRQTGKSTDKSLDSKFLNVVLTGFTESADVSK